jgi:hypothetical protein
MNNCAILAGPARNQRGMALISALLLLLVISLLAVGVSMDSSMDVRMAAYQNFKGRAFGSSEGGMMTAGDILVDNISESGWPGNPDPFSYPNLSAEYDDLVAGNILIHGNGTFFLEENLALAPVITMSGEIQADAAVQRVGAALAKGGAMQVAAGYAGTGKGLGGGGAHIIYNIEVTGNDAGQGETTLAMHYRYVTK